MTANESKQAGARYDIYMHSDDVQFLRESEDGDYVRYEDYAAAIAERDRLQDELDLTRAGLEFAKDAAFRLSGDAAEKYSTPAFGCHIQMEAPFGKSKCLTCGREWEALTPRGSQNHCARELGSLVAALIQQRDELLAALKDARARLRALVGPSYDIDPCPETRRLDAAIAKASGGAA